MESFRGVKLNKWFEVDTAGLAQLQAGKPKTFIVNELVQNAWDEDITLCGIRFKYEMDNKLLTITVQDDSPEGFKNITHAYTLFADTYKRSDPTKRGRFNLGEKQVIAICEEAIVKTTKGTIIFDYKGRHETEEKTDTGSKIIVTLKASFNDYKEVTEHAKKLLVPNDIIYTVDGVEVPPRKIFKTFKAKLLTDILNGETFKVQTRETKVNLVESNGQSYIYEMGIPILKTDCPWHIDVQQKVQLNIDRDNILPSYLQDLYAEVLNHTFNDIEEPSALWVRTAMKDKRATPEAVKGIMNKRFVDKFCIANPLDKKSMEEAISKGYNPIFGGEMSKEEWAIIKDKVDIESSTQLFGHNALAEAEVVKPSNCMTQTALYTKNIASRILGIKVDIKFVKSAESNVAADYSRTDKVLRFNVARLPKSFFENPVSSQTTELIIHELAHEDGGHIDYSYQEKCCEIGAKLSMLALKEPEFFKVTL